MHQHKHFFFIYFFVFLNYIFFVRSSYFVFLTFTSLPSPHTEQLFEQDIGPLKRSLSVKTRRFSRISDLALVTKTKWCPLNVFWARNCYVTALCCCPCSREVSCFHTTQYKRIISFQKPIIVMSVYLCVCMCVCDVLYAFAMFLHLNCMLTLVCLFAVVVFSSISFAWKHKNYISLF